MRCLSIHITDLCNSKCSFCVVGSPLYSRDSINLQNILSFIQDNAANFDVVNLHGGEATIHPKFLEIMDFIKASGIDEIHLQTNAIRLGRREFCDAVCSRGVTLFIVSMHGHTPEMHDGLTGTSGGFEKTCLGIRNVKSAGRRVRTNTVVTRQNISRLSEVVRLCVELGADHINISNFHPAGSGYLSFEADAPSMTEVREHLYQAIELGENAGRQITLEGFPYCVVRERGDLHLNESYREIRMLMRGRVIDNYDSFMNEVCREFGPPCVSCELKAKCGGIYKEYAQYRGWREFQALSLPSAP